MSTARATDPAKIVIGSAEKQTPACDFTDALGAAEVPSLPVTTLTNLATDAVYAAGLNGTPALSGSAPWVVSQGIQSLAAGQSYRLTWQVTIAAASPAKVIQLFTDIEVDF